MATKLYTTPTLYDGVTKFFEPSKNFMLNGEIYNRGEYHIFTYSGNEPFKEGKYTMFYLASNENQGLLISVPTPCYKFSVNGANYTDPSLLYEAIYNATSTNVVTSSDAVLQEILNKLPQPKTEPNHYSANGTITFPANTQTSITIKAVGDLSLTVNGNVETLLADDVVTFSTEFILSKAITVTGDYFIVAIGDKII